MCSVNQVARPPANGNQTKYRYTDLLTCQECGNPFVPMIRYWNGKRCVEYACRGSHCNGKGYCGSQRVHEEALDAAVWGMRKQRTEKLKQLQQRKKCVC